MALPLSIGDYVTCKTDEEAYGSNYGGRPVQQFRAGMLGVVARLDVPAVRGRGRRASFTCVDFIGDDGEVWRCALYSDNIRKLRPRELAHLDQHRHDDLIGRQFLEPRSTTPLRVSGPSRLQPETHVALTCTAFDGTLRDWHVPVAVAKLLTWPEVTETVSNSA